MKKTLLIAVLILAFSRFCGFDVLLFHIKPPPVAVTDDPYQRTFRFYHPDITERGPYHLEALGTVSITGRVLGTKDYSKEETGDLIPLDIALGWKRMADPAILKHFRISQGNRSYVWHFDSGSPTTEREVDHSSVNTHLIPADNEVYATLKSIAVGQTVNMRGYLVKATMPATGWYWSSAMDGGDVMVGLGCKLIYVQSVDILG